MDVKGYMDEIDYATKQGLWTHTELQIQMEMQNSAVKS